MLSIKKRILGREHNRKAHDARRSVLAHHPAGFPRHSQARCWFGMTQGLRGQEPEATRLQFG